MTRRPRPASRPPPTAELRDLQIHSIGGQGDGLATGPAGPIATPLTLAGERVRARVAGDRGELVEVLEASSQRVVPPCPHFGACGGCALQHWAIEPYRLWKLDRVNALLRRAGLEAPASLAHAAGEGERRRLALHARRVGGRVRLGFKGRRSWDLVPVEVCPISAPGLVAALPALADVIAPLLSGADRSAPTLHVTLTTTGLDVDVTGIERPGPTADALAQVAQRAAAANLARFTLAGEAVYRVRAPLVRVGPALVELPPGGFLQATEGAEAAMGTLVVGHAAGARSAVDLYCGVGAFAFRLAGAASVRAADASTGAVEALRRALATAPGLKAIVAETRDLDRRPMLAAELSRTEFAVFDPPRAGAPAQAAELARSKVPRVAAVSCNPTTFVRDAGLLVDGGYRLEQVHLVDQFLWSSHIELVALFSRSRP